jgi:hypothetical protein
MRLLNLCCFLMIILFSCKKKEDQQQTEPLKNYVDELNYVIVDGIKHRHLVTQEVSTYYTSKYMFTRYDWWTPGTAYVGLSYPGSSLEVRAFDSDSQEVRGFSNNVNVDIIHAGGRPVFRYDSVRLVDPADTTKFFYVSGQSAP